MTDERSARRVQAVDSAMNRAAGSRPIPGNTVLPLIDGPDTYGAMFELIEGARRWIHLENYIIRSDAVGLRFAELLARRAREGVRVRVLYDWLGSIGTKRGYWRSLRAAGVEVRSFNPLRPLDLVPALTRDHRKLVVADGTRAVIGGLCIGCEWTGESEPGCEPWRDTAVDIQGPAAAALDQAFAVTWGISGGTIPEGESAASVPPSGSAEVRVIAGEPGRERVYRVIEQLTAGSLERLWITDAYLVAPARLFLALRDAASDGVDVRLLVPGSSDIPLVRNVTRIGYRELLRAGVRIFEWDGPMLHAKSVTADQRWVRVGSSNINPASLIGNYELDVLVEDPALAEALEGQFRRDVSRSREVSRRRVRGPQRISARLPSALTHLEPEHPLPPARHGRREIRQRAALALRTVASGARRSLFGPMSLVLVVLAALFLVLPRATAYVFAVICIWLALGAAREAFRRRADR
ncbi:MAG TPA: phospholipase D-like domain-containing protein [Gemmatimonadales bacterium]